MGEEGKPDAQLFQLLSNLLQQVRLFISISYSFFYILFQFRINLQFSFFMEFYHLGISLFTILWFWDPLISFLLLFYSVFVLQYSWILHSLLYSLCFYNFCLLRLVIVVNPCYPECNCISGVFSSVCLILLILTRESLLFLLWKIMGFYNCVVG